MSILQVNGLTKRFGGVTAVSDVSFEVRAGTITGIIGPNGAGKTTLFNLLTGVFRPSAGRVIFDGIDVTNRSTHARAALGLIRTFQTTNLFNQMTVLQSVVVAHHLVRKSSLAAQIAGIGRARIEAQAIQRASLEILDQFGLFDMKGETAGNLPHGHQRALGIALAFVARPKVLLLDEPVTGMNQTETADMTRTIRGLCQDRGLTIIVVEHDMAAIMGLSEHIVVLNFGKKIAEGPPQEVVTRQDVIEAYLGPEEED